MGYDRAVVSPAYTGTRLRQITPTDVAQFIRLEQCERYLRLRLQTRAQEDRFLRDQGIQPESIPPLLPRSGGHSRVLARFW